MADLHYTPQALDDLESIWQYMFESWGIEQATAYAERLERRCTLVAEGEPARVKEVTTGEGTCLMVRQDHHRIFFYRNGMTVILAILHDRMDLIRHLEDRL